MRYALAACTLALFATSAARAEEPLRVLVIEPSGDAVDKSVRETVASLVSIELAKAPKLDVVAAADVKKMAALEADKQALGCDEAGSCLAELAGAMGARFVLFGDAAKLGTLTVVNLSLFDSKAARAVGRVSIQVTGLEDLPQRIRPAVHELVQGAPDLRAATEGAFIDEPASPVVASAGPSPLPAIAMWSLVGLGAVVGIGGLAFDVTSATSANGHFDALDVVGPVALGLGGATIAGGLAIGLLAGGSDG